MAQLIFDEESYLNGNIFQFEQRLQSHANKYIENGAILTTYYSQDENSSTVDRGLRDIDELFGSHAPLRYNAIKNFPIYGFGQTNPENTDEMQITDINVEGEATIIPSTIVPKHLDFFTINHMKMIAIFEVVDVKYDSMKPDGFYKINYRLVSTSAETLQKLQNQCVNQYYTDLNAIGSDTNPMLTEDDYVYKKQVIQLMNKMIQTYRALFYNSRHNCFLYHNQHNSDDLFDMCGNEFISNHSLMNPTNTPDVIMLNDKLHESQLQLHYANSVYAWLEMDAPLRMLNKFNYILNDGMSYQFSSFARYHELSIRVIQPISVNQADINWQHYSIFDGKQLDGLMADVGPVSSEYERLLWKFIHKKTALNIHDIPLSLGDALMTNAKNSIDTFFYVPMMVFIIRKILRVN